METERGRFEPAATEPSTAGTRLSVATHLLTSMPAALSLVDAPLSHPSGAHSSPVLVARAGRSFLSTKVVTPVLVILSLSSDLLMASTPAAKDLPSPQASRSSAPSAGSQPASPQTGLRDTDQGGAAAGSQPAAETAMPCCTSFEKKSFSVAAGEVQAGDRYFFGRGVRIDGKLDGDLFAFGESVKVSGEVTRDLNAAASGVTVSGKVGDDVRVASGEMVVSGSIAGDLLAVSGKVRVEPGATIGGSTLVGGGEVVLEGNFKGPVRAGAGQVTFGGTADGDVRIEADVIEFEPGAHIKGNLTYTARREIEILKSQADAGGGRFVEGKVSFVSKAPKNQKASSEGRHFRYVLRTWSFIAAFILGCVIIAISRGMVRTITETAQADILRSLGFGVLGHIFAPFAGVILLILCLTFPAGVLVLVGWAVLFYLAKLVVSLALADGLLRKMGFYPSPYISLLLGMIPVWILFAVPILGSLLYWFVVPIFGIGAILIGVRAHAKRTNGTPNPPEAAAAAVA